MRCQCCYRPYDFEIEPMEAFECEICGLVLCDRCGKLFDQTSINCPQCGFDYGISREEYREQKEKEETKSQGPCS